MILVNGSFQGHSAAINVGLGFVPVYVKLWNGEDPNTLEWTISMRDDYTVDSSEGIGGDDGTLAAVAATAGIKPYRGGDVIATASEAYKVKDPLPNKIDAGAGSAISKFTLDTPGSYTGHFDQPIDTTEVQVGAKVIIDGQTYWITAVSNDGDAADDITLDRDTPTGPCVVSFVGGWQPFRAAAAGTIMPAGFTISVTGGCNVDGETTNFVAYHSLS